MDGIAKMAIKLDRSVPNPLRVPDHLFQLPAVITAVGKRNSGKTTAVASLLRDYQAAGLVQRAWLISPNADSEPNKRLFDGIVAPDDLRREPTPASFESVLDELKLEAEEWQEYRRSQELYKELRKYRGRPDEIPDELCLACYALGLFDGPPVYKYGNVAWPSFVLILDDVQSTPIMSSSVKNPLNSVFVRNRHVHKIGCTVVMMVQDFKARSGIPAHVRSNTTVFLLWRMASEARRKQVAEELANDLDPKEFLKIYEHAIGEDDNHSFLCVDFDQKKARRYRRNFDQILNAEDYQ